MGVKLYIDAEMGKRFDDLEKKLDDMTPFYKNLADLELSATLGRFKKEVDPEFKPWIEPNTRRPTGRAKPKTRPFSRAFSDKILRDTSTLYNSIGRAFGKDFASVGTNLSYAEYHQDGTNNIRQRKMFGINNATRDALKKLIESYLGLKK